jgi:hypothetical protein
VVTIGIEGSIASSSTEDVARGEGEDDAMISGLEYTERPPINNSRTLDAIVRALDINRAQLKQSGNTLTPTDYGNKHTFTPADLGFLELLPTGDVKGVWWLLIQHR